MSIITDIETKLAEFKSSKILIHSDILFGFKLPFVSQEQFLESHFSALKSVCKGYDMIFPVFNYDFCKGKPFDVKKDPSQVGTFSEFFRSNHADWRSAIPVFSFSGTGAVPEYDFNQELDPFGGNSIFAYLHKTDSVLMHYGSGFHTTTFIHYIERISGKLIYRYDKTFNGDVLIDNHSDRVSLKYHVRPMGYSLDYDWPRLENDLIHENILFKFKEGRTKVILCKINYLVDFWLKKINENPFYLLNADSHKWVSQKYHSLKRPFVLEDFE